MEGPIIDWHLTRPPILTWTARSPYCTSMDKSHPNVFQKAVCANEHYYLPGDFSLVCWSPAKSEAFVAACSLAWVNEYSGKPHF